MTSSCNSILLLMSSTYFLCCWQTSNNSGLRFMVMNSYYDSALLLVFRFYARFLNAFFNSWTWSSFLVTYWVFSHDTDSVPMFLFGFPCVPWILVSLFKIFSHVSDLDLDLDLDLDTGEKYILSIFQLLDQNRAYPWILILKFKSRLNHKKIFTFV